MHDNAYISLAKYLMLIFSVLSLNFTQPNFTGTSDDKHNAYGKITVLNKSFQHYIHAY